MAQGKSGAAAVEQDILRLCSEDAEGVANEVVTGPAGPLSHIDLAVRVQALNNLLSAGKVSLFKHGATLRYKAAAEQDKRAKGLNAEELLVLQVIKQAGNTGMWTKDMKFRTNLAQPQITKILKTLEGRSLIKAVKDVNNPGKKIYILFDLEPAKEMTGGAWYTDQQLDREFIDVLRETSFKIVNNSEGGASLADIAEFINSKGLARMELREQDIRTIMNTLVGDCRVEAVEGPDGEDRFRPVVLALPGSTAFTTIPCGVCPVIDQCKDGGQISPHTCVYYQTWLDF